MDFGPSMLFILAIDAIEVSAMTGSCLFFLFQFYDLFLPALSWGEEGTSYELQTASLVQKSSGIFQTFCDEIPLAKRFSSQSLFSHWFLEQRCAFQCAVCSTPYIGCCIIRMHPLNNRKSLRSNVNLLSYSFPRLFTLLKIEAIGCDIYRKIPSRQDVGIR